MKLRAQHKARLDELADAWDSMPATARVMFMRQAPKAYFATAKVVRWWQVERPPAKPTKTGRHWWAA